MPQTILLLDGFSLLHRAFYALPPLNAPDGTPVNALYGMCNMLWKLLEEHQPKAVVAAMDKKGPTFRKEKYDAYKAQRKPMPPELSAQLPLLSDLWAGFGVEEVGEEGFEADDIIGTLAKRASRNGDKVLIITGDRDSYQLIDENITVGMTKRGTSDLSLMDEAAFAEAYGGLKPLQLIDLKALMGDASDNIPGVAGVGEKTALSLIQTYGSLRGVYDNIDAITRKKLHENLMTCRDDAFMSYDLATIVTDVPLCAECIRDYSGMDVEKLRAFFQRLGSAALLKKLPAAEAEEATAFEMEEKPYLATGPVVFYQGKEAVFAVSENGGMTKAPDLGPWQAALTANRPVIYFDGKPTFHRLQGANLPIPKGEDLSLMAYLLDPGQSLKGESLIMKYLGTLCESDDAVAANLPELYRVMADKLEKDGLLDLYRTMELPLSHLLFEMEQNGIQVDTAVLTELSDLYQNRMKELEAEVFAEAGETFNLQSPKQLGTVLFEHMNLPVLKKTKTGYSTDVDVLTSLAKMYPICGKILEYRTYAKLYSTYGEGLRKLLHEDGTLHTTFQQTVTATGRLSSTDPNLQNIPVKTDIGRELRRVFVPFAENHLLLCADYSQIELRVLAHMTGDSVLQMAYRAGADIHTTTAAQIFGISPEAVTKEQRRSAKTVNFGIVYGMSGFSLSGDLGITPKEAQAYIDGYFAAYPLVRPYIDGVIASAREQGYVTTFMGRRRYMPDIKHTNFQKRSFAERAAVNATIQGSAADLMKAAMLEVDKRMKEQGLKSRMLLQVHDELVFDVPMEEAEIMETLVRDTMENIMELSVPLVAEVSLGKSWLEAK